MPKSRNATSKARDATTPKNTPIELEYIAWRDANIAQVRGKVLLIRTGNQTIPAHWNADAGASSMKFLREWAATAELPSATEDFLSVKFEHSLVEYRWPRRLEWTALPVTVDAYFKMSPYLMITSIDEMGGMLLGGAVRPAMTREFGSTSPEQYAVTAEAFASCACIVFDLGRAPFPQEVADLAHLLAIYRAANSWPRCFSFDGREVVVLEPGTVRQSWNASKPEHRFRWSFKVNACILMRRAYLEAASAAGRGFQIDQSAFRLFERFSNIASVEAIQILYLIGQSGPPITIEDAADNPPEMDPTARSRHTRRSLVDALAKLGVLEMSVTDGMTPASVGLDRVPMPLMYPRWLRTCTKRSANCLGLMTSAHLWLRASWRLTRMATCA